MPRPWTVIETAETPDGPLTLRQRGPRDFMIQHGGRVLMTSAYHRSEVALAQLGCMPIADRPRPKVLIGGAGLGYTLRAALDALPAGASVTVAELNPVVLRWCAGPLAVLSEDALGDRRTRAVAADVMDEVGRAGRRAKDRLDAIVLDLYIGPDDTRAGARHPLYGDAAIESVHAALTEGGSYAVWGEEPSPSFERRLQRAGFKVTTERTRGRGPHHVIFLGRKGKARRAAPRRSRP